MQTELTFYRDPANPLLGTTPSATWQFPGSALSASSIRVYPSTMRVVSATWFLVWNPSAGPTFNAVRLVTADNGPMNLQQIAFLNRNQVSTPIVQSVDITAAFRAIAEGQTSRQILMQTCGDTQSRIFRSTIDVVWSAPEAA